jgi:hypothetical protein
LGNIKKGFGDFSEDMGLKEEFGFFLGSRV